MSKGKKKHILQKETKSTLSIGSKARSYKGTQVVETADTLYYYI